jgi:Ca-activated chloride channel family protein
MREIASRSGGEAFEVDDANALDEVYERLGSRIGTRSERREVSSAFAGGALVLLLGGLFGGVRRRARLP